ncbi:hypothetical protein [Nocardia cyriacigeorgica]|uniref:Uncharacterized protein n=1 Tax=Nocardia cyriacigeorgica TaxID=135487 RepID=A0A6P1DHH5_9NOCA|nr:hypothetical protein [Nocardia cyriacigeorgica]NEW42532.1 hypothetical protein [Nocardia cyriacigeorgica]NEW48033.1 hypothetical protein [Nocardia cyriacigeorgica]
MSPHDEVNAANAAFARGAGWPELTGSAAQLGWAETLRADKMRAFEAAHTQTPASDAALFREAMLRETDAGVWIDTRLDSWQAMLVHGLTHDELDTLLAASKQETTQEKGQPAA